MDQGSAISIRTKLRPGDTGYIVFLHGTLYAAECGWDHTFEAYVAVPLADFALRDNPRERIWIAEDRSRLVASIAIIETSARRAQLRWFLVHPDLRGQGVGKRLLDASIAFCREVGYTSISLWTVAGLDAARKLYDAVGFTLAEEEMHERWGALVTEQRFELALLPSSHA